LDQLELLVTWDNSKVYKLLVEHERNTFGFTIFIYCNNEGNEVPVCYFSNTWNTIKWSGHRREFYLGELINEISTWNTSPDNDVTAFADLPIIDTFDTLPYREKNDSLHPDSDHEENAPEEPSVPTTSESDPTTLHNIRNAPIPSDARSPTTQPIFPFPASSQRAATAAANINMMLTHTTPGLTQTNVSARTAMPPATATSTNVPTADKVHSTLLAFLCRTPGRGGGGGGSSSGGGGGGVPLLGLPQAARQNVPAP
jgi:hypothetical protein